MSKSVIATLPMNEADRGLLVQFANDAFERVLTRMEPQNPEGTRRLWDADAYVDAVITPEKLPLEQGYALDLIEAFLVHRVAELAARADASEVHAQ